MPPRVLVELDIVISKAALLISECAVDQLFELLHVERLESKNLRARHQRAVHVKERIVCGRANQTEISGLDIGQKNVLLRLIEMMDLINEQDRPLPRSPATIRRRSDSGERSFAAAGRSGKNY